MTFRHLAAAAAAAAALAAVTSATAGSFANASIGQFSYTLFDLNPGDGIAPDVSFSLASSPYGSYVTSSATDPTSGSESSTGWSLVAFGPAAVASAIGLGSAQGSVSGSPSAGGMLYQATGAALGSSVPGASTQFSASAAIANFGSLTFSLSPFTLIVFNGTANLLAQTTLGLNPIAFQSEQASASASINVSGPSASGGQGFQNSGDNRSLFASFTSVFDPGTGQFVYTGQTVALDNLALSASFTNFSADAMSGQLSLSVSVNGSSPLTPIPEPGSAVLLLAGLAGLGWWTRRRA